MDRSFGMIRCEDIFTGLITTKGVDNSGGGGGRGSAAFDILIL